MEVAVAKATAPLPIPDVIGIEWKNSGWSPPNTVSIASCYNFVAALTVDGTVLTAREVNGAWQTHPARMRMTGEGNPQIFCNWRETESQFYISVSGTGGRQVWRARQDSHGSWGYVLDFTISDFTADWVTHGNILEGSSWLLRFYAIAHDGALFSSGSGASGTWSRLGTISGAGHKIDATAAFAGGNALSVLTSDRHLYVGTGNDSQWTWMDNPRFLHHVGGPQPATTRRGTDATPDLDALRGAGVRVLLDVPQRGHAEAHRAAASMRSCFRATVRAAAGRQLRDLGRRL
jgi:hypothetical protein